MENDKPKLPLYDAMSAAIEEFEQLMKAPLDEGDDLETYVRIALNTEPERNCIRIRTRAWRKAGKIVREGRRQ